MRAADCPVCGVARLQPWQVQDGRAYARCPHCEATVLEASARLDAVAERAYYGLHRNDPDDARYRAFLARLAGPLLARLPPQQHGLDYGCGPGPALAAMLEAAGHRVALYDPLFRPDEAVLQQRYGFITCTEVVEHFHQPAREFARFDALLQPGGWLAIMTALLDDGIDFERWHYRRDPTHVVFYRPQAFRVLAARYGWQCEFPVPDVVLLHKPYTAAGKKHGQPRRGLG